MQALTGAKGKFIRTPKVRNRTVPAFLYVVLPYLLVAWSVYTFKVAWESRPLVERGLRRAQRGARHLRDHRLHRHPQLAGGHLDQRRLLALQAAGPGAAGRAERPSSLAAGAESGSTDWEMVLYLGFADRRRRSRQDPTWHSPIGRP